MVQHNRKLQPKDIHLINIARNTLIVRESEYSKTCCAIRTKSGKIFTSINIKIHDSAPCSICAEQAAIAHIVTAGELPIDTIVTVCTWKEPDICIIPPCGMCAEFIKQFGNPHIIVSPTSKIKLLDL